MTWSKIAGVLKRLDSRLSDAVYLHGCYLTGQEKIVRHHPQDEGRAHSQEFQTPPASMSRVNCGSTDGQSFHC